MLDSRTLSLLLNTLYLAAATCAVSVPLGVVLAGLLWRTDFPGRNFWRAVLTAMLFVPLYLQAAAWQAGFGLQGWWTAITQWPPPVDGWRGAIWIHAMAALPWVVLIVGLGLRRSERELEEAALLDASPRQVFFRVTLKNALPAVGAAVLWVAVTTAGEMTVTDFFAIRTYAEELYTQIAIGQEPGVPPPSVWLGIVLTVILILAGVKFLRFFVPRERPLGVAHPLIFPLGRWRWPAVCFVGLFFLVFMGIPLGNLIYQAGTKGVLTDAGPERYFSISKCFEMIFRARLEFSREIGWSMLMGSIAATFAVAVGTFLAWWGKIPSPLPLGEGPGVRADARTWRKLFNYRFAILLGIAVLFSIPGPLIGFGVIRLLNQPAIPRLCWLYDHTILAPTLAMTLKSLPAATLVMWYAMQSIPREVLESAAVDGAGSWTQLFRIALPMRWSAAAAAWLIALAVSLGDLAAGILVVPPGVSTLSISIFGLLHYGVEDRVAGVCLGLIVLYAVLAAMVLAIFSRTAKSR
jgi:iron(III) transport system permease protein